MNMSHAVVARAATPPASARVLITRRIALPRVRSSTIYSRRRVLRMPSASSNGARHDDDGVDDATMSAKHHAGCFLEAPDDCDYDPPDETEAVRLREALYAAVDLW